MATRRDTELILRDLGTAQHGVVARAQLIDRGLSVHTVDRLVRVRRLVVVQRGVYQIGPLPLPRSAEKAAVLAGGCDARASHLSAARLAGIVENDRHVDTVEVTMPRRRRRQIDGVRIHRVRDLRADEVAVLDGIPVTTPARTLLDLAETETGRVVEQAYATSLRKRLVTSDEMRAMVERHPTHRGAPLWRRLLAEHDAPPFTRSRAENLLALTQKAGLPRPELNVQVLGHEVDFVWRDARVIVEVDGYAFHASAHSFGADRRRDAELTAAGYRVLRFTWSDLGEGRFATIVRLAQALSR
ncbi:MAG TPA: DUF559 domain-containing protein [Longimicrobiales bacterium]|nr:DUF559 domain-containing protein [Longimicrobiales bacterium]